MADDQTLRLSFDHDCRELLRAVFEALKRDARRIAGVEGSDAHLPGLSGRAERHFQAVAFSGLTGNGRRVTVEDQYYGFDDKRTNVQATDLAVELSDGRWLWIELKRFLPGNVGFASAAELRSDVAKLDDVGHQDARNLPQGVLFALLRDDASRAEDLSLVWERRVKELAGSFSFRECQIAGVPFSERRSGELLVGLWARETLVPAVESQD